VRVEVIKTEVVEDENKDYFKATLKGKDQSKDIELRMTLKSPSKSVLEDVIPFKIGASRDISLRDMNAKITDFQEGFKEEDL